MTTIEEDAAVSGRRNLYVSAQDQDIWERAEKLASPESLSSLVTTLLRRYVEQREAPLDRIVVEIHDRAGHVTRKAFKGRMLVSGFETDDESTLPGGRLFAAQGASGGLAIWTGYSDDATNPAAAVDLFTFPSFEAAAAFEWGEPGPPLRWPRDFLSAVSSALGEEYAEEIDL